MSESSHAAVRSKPEHGTTRSYVIGFLLSVGFTIVSYYLVVNHSISGNKLLGVITGFAILQMLIQVLFFLHLGRGPKPLYNVVFFVSTVGIILVVVSGSLFIMEHLHYNMTPTEATKNLAEKEGVYQVGGVKTGACQEIKVHHKVIISSGKVSPVFTRAQLCDTLTFINQDDVVREIGFGEHPLHGGYGGQDSLLVYKGRGKTITLNQAGAYQFHDHLDPTIVGELTVAE